MFEYVENEMCPYRYYCGQIEIKAPSLPTLREQVLRVFNVDILTILN